MCGGGEAELGPVIYVCVISISRKDSLFLRLL